MSDETKASNGRASAPNNAQANASSGSQAQKTKTQPKRRGRHSPITEEFWAELRELYETGNYSQRDLVTYARTRGIKLTQPRIARKAGEEGWLKGVRIEELRERFRDEMKEQLGDTYRKMLDNHTQQARLLQGEGMQHIRAAHERRKVDPDYLIPTALLRQLTSQLREAQEMEGRALGWDVREGRPFKSADEEQEQQIESMRVDVMSPAEEERIRQDAEKQAMGLADTSDIEIPGDGDA